ncbi:class I SAM-dependent rRNA methyltransferase [Candidatus Sumerlaeota bacterium]|nr:class I SAM-dependent rRNA methyltransferase [Candidatus Sumerlaeota bacterium]
MPFPAIHLDEKSSARVGRGHRWIFSNDISNIDANAENGGEVAVFSAKKEFLGSALLNRRALIAARLYSEKSLPFDAEHIRSCVALAAAHRAQWLPNRRTCRVVFSESDGLPGLIVDRYEDVLVVQFLTLAMEQRRNQVVDILADVLQAETIVERSDSSGREYEGLPESTGVIRGAVPEELVVDLNGILMRVDVLGGQKTGMYLDQVENWSLIRGIVKDRRVLDLFCNLGGFALNAAKFGASAVKAVDSSEPALSQLVVSAFRNNLTRITAKKSDGFLYVRSRPDNYDVIVCDPPPFAKSRKQLEGALRGYRELNRSCMKMLGKEGILLSFSCSAAVGAEDFDKMLMLAARDAGRSFRVLPGGGQPPDHAPLLAMPETQYLKARTLQAVD